MKRWTGIALSLLLILSIASAQNLNGSDAVSNAEYAIGVGDQIRITYYQGVSFDDPGKVVETTVGEEGKVLVPLIGKVQVVGRTPNEIQTELLQQLRKYVESPQVFVEVLDYQSITALLFGSTMSQGVFPLLPNTTATQFIAQHGGVPGSSDLERVSVLRANGELVLLDLRSFFEEGVITQDIVLQSGDRVFVPWKEPTWLERTARVVQLVSLVLQTVILIIVLGS